MFGIRSLGTLIRVQGIGDLYKIYVSAKRDGSDYNLAFMPDEFQMEQNEEFDPEYMSSLFELGYNMASNGYPWFKKPPGIKEH